MTTTAANDFMLEIAVDAAATGHDLSGIIQVEDSDGRPNGWKARSRECGRGETPASKLAGRYSGMVPSR